MLIWMKDGQQHWNTLSELMKTEKRLLIPSIKISEQKWITSPATEQDQPLITMSTQVSGAGYGNNSYVKSSLSYLALKDYLGDALFKKRFTTIWTIGMVNIRCLGTISFL